MTATLRHQALAILCERDPDRKAAAARALDPDAALDPAELLVEPSGIPGRPDRPALVDPAQLESRSVQTTAGRAALIHAIVHIELNAIDLALDAVWRFPGMPHDYYRDWLTVAREESLHFSLLRDHLQRLGHRYGELAAHGALWEMAERTKGDVLARMALVPRTLEARGLDASPQVRRKLLGAGDRDGAAIIDLLLRDEIGHVAIGNRWFRWLCTRRGEVPEAAYAALAAAHRAPRPRGPFNLAARRAAGFSEDELAALG